MRGFSFPLPEASDRLAARACKPYPERQKGAVMRRGNSHSSDKEISVEDVTKEIERLQAAGKYDEAIALMDDGEVEETEPEEAAEELSAGPKEKTEAEVTPEPAKAKEEPKPEVNPDGVLLKDGQRVLPYSVLEASRREARASEKRAKELEKERAGLLEQMEALKARVPADIDPLADLDGEELSPAVVKAIKALDAKIKSTEAKLAPVKAEAEAADPEQEAVDSIPELATWQAAKSKEWRVAVRHDKGLATDPDWADKPLVERFAHAVKLTRAELDIPDPTVKPNAAPLKPAKERVVTSLSDIPGGMPSDQDPSESFDKLSGAATVAKMRSMPQAKIDEHLRRYG